MAKVKFTRVGRDKHSWEAELPDSSLNSISKEARRGGKLMSSDVDAEFDANSETQGLIIVGGWRPVGEFEVING